MYKKDQEPHPNDPFLPWCNKHVFLLPLYGLSFKEESAQRIRYGNFDTYSPLVVHSFTTSDTWKNYIEDIISESKAVRASQRYQELFDGLQDTKIQQFLLTQPLPDLQSVELLFPDKYQQLYDEFRYDPSFETAREFYDPHTQTLFETQYTNLSKALSYVIPKVYPGSITDPSYFTWTYRNNRHLLLQSNYNYTFKEYTTTKNYRDTGPRQIFDRYVQQNPLDKDIWMNQGLGNEKLPYTEVRVLQTTEYIRRQLQLLEVEGIEPQVARDQFDHTVRYLQHLWGQHTSPDPFSLREESQHLPDALPSVEETLKHIYLDRRLSDDSNLFVAGSKDPLIHLLKIQKDFFHNTQLYPLAAAGIPDGAVIALLLGHQVESIIPLKNRVYFEERQDLSKIPLLVDHMVNSGATVKKALGQLFQTHDTVRLLLTCDDHAETILKSSQWKVDRIRGNNVLSLYTITRN